MHAIQHIPRGPRLGWPDRRRRFDIHDDGMIQIDQMDRFDKTILLVE